MSKTNTHPTTPNAPAFSFRRRSGPFSKPNYPGPGSFNPEKRPNSIGGYSFGRSSRDKYGDKKIPGPGDYSPQYKPKTSVRIGTELRPQTFAKGKNYVGQVKTLLPGPGTHDPPCRSIEGPQYSLVKRQHVNVVKDIPGPANYSPKDCTVQVTNPLYRFGDESKRLVQADNFNPGPGHYEAKSQLEGRDWGFGSSSRDKSHGKGHPGYVYEVPSTFASIPQYLRT